MAKKARRLGAGKTYGSRYGRNLRNKVAIIKKITSARSKCPYCNFVAVKRVATGIFHCRKCEAKFTGKAYAPAKKIVVTTAPQVVEEVVEEVVEAEKVTEEATK